MMKSSAAFLGILLILPGCISHPQNYRTAPHFDTQRTSIKTITVVEPRIEIFEVSAGGVREKVEEWCAIGSRNVKLAMETELASKSTWRVRPFSQDALSKEAKDNLKDTYALFDAVNSSLFLHSYNRAQPQFIFPETVTNFNYSLGPEVRDLAADADALLLVYGIDHVATSGRKAIQAGTMVVGALLGVVAVPRSGPNLVVAALIEAKTGSILWYNLRPYGNLRDETEAGTIAKELLVDLHIN
jgi:hypothetical protein